MTSVLRPGSLPHIGWPWDRTAMPSGHVGKQACWVCGLALLLVQRTSGALGPRRTPACHVWQATGLDRCAGTRIKCAGTKTRCEHITFLAQSPVPGARQVHTRCYLGLQTKAQVSAFRRLLVKEGARTSIYTALGSAQGSDFSFTVQTHSGAWIWGLLLP